MAICIARILLAIFTGPAGCRSWAVRRLSALIPRIQDTQVQTNLFAMLEAHHINVERVDTRKAVDPRAQRG
jgi:hypothetical protein